MNFNKVDLEEKKLKENYLQNFKKLENKKNNNNYPDLKDSSFSNSYDEEYQNQET